jgi:membrane fusion protein (multidrug efflux system)
MEANTIETQEKETPKKKSRGFIIVLVLLLVVGSWFGITKYTHAQHHIETDDAQVEANISQVIPRISGYVSKILVKDNQYVKKGDTLLVLDDRELKLKVEQAEAALRTAQSNLGAAQASVSTANANTSTSRTAIGTIDAQIEAAKVNVRRATQDYERYANLIRDHSITQQQFEQQQAAKETAERQLQILEEQKKQASSQVAAVATQGSSTAQQVSIAGSTIKQRQVEIEEAKLALSYAVVTAPEDGTVSKVDIQVGQYLTAGQSLFSLVLNKNVWVVANFKETQFQKMHEGQRVTVDIDAFPGHIFEAQVSSFAAATGARFALLPPDNSSGNFIKVVQRIPIKIEFKQQDSIVQKLRAGMNANVDVHVD